MAAVSEPLDVLFVEDDVEFVEMYRAFLEMDGYRVRAAYDGRMGLEAIRRSRPDMVFIDMRMPEMTGLELLRALRADPATEDLPAVVLSNYDEPEMVQEAHRLGALQWVVKADTTPRGLVERMAAWLREEEREVSSDRQP